MPIAGIHKRNHKVAMAVWRLRKRVAGHTRKHCEWLLVQQMPLAAWLGASPRSLSLSDP
jgi:hypothetical protein